MHQQQKLKKMETNKMVMGTSDVFLQKSKTAVQLKFEDTAKEVQRVVNQCKAIKITDATTLSIAEQSLSLANKMLKASEEKRKDIGRPYKEVVDYVNKFVKDNITSHLEEAIEYGKKELKKWNDSEELKRKQIEELNNKHLNLLVSVRNSVTRRISQCATASQCDELTQEVNAKWVDHNIYGIYANESSAAKFSALQLIALRKDMIQASTNVTTESIDIIQESSNNTVSILEQQDQIMSSAVDKKNEALSNVEVNKGKFRRDKKFKVFNEDLIPRQFLMIDEAKVKEFMKTLTTEQFQEQVVINGFKFYIEETPVMR